MANSFTGPVTSPALAVTVAQQITTNTSPNYSGFAVSPKDGKIWVGDGSVTAGNGTPVEQGGVLVVDTKHPERWYVVADAGTVHVAVNLFDGV